MNQLVSDAFCDEITVLFFRALPAVDGPQLSYLVHAVVRLAGAEVKRAVAEMRARDLAGSEN